MDAELVRIYGNKVRVRICGLCWQDEDLLLVNHRSVAQYDFWAPPGGGLVFGESIQQCLVREFEEETGLKVTPGRFVFGCQFVKPPLHAIELFFEVVPAGGILTKGDDPETPIIKEVKFMSPADIRTLPKSSLHGIFSVVSVPGQLKTLSGFFTI